MSAAGGAPRRISPTAGDVAGGDWNARGTIAFSAGSHLFRVSAAGGVPERLRTPGDADESTTQTFPQFLPDGQHFVYVSTSVQGDESIAIGSLDGAPIRRLARAHRAAYVAPGLILFLRGTSLMAQRFDASALKLEGEPSIVAANAAAGYIAGVESFAARDNILVFVPTLGGNHGRLTWFDRAGRPLAAMNPTDASEYLNPALSPGGDKVAVNRFDDETGIWNVWTVDAVRDVATRFTNGPSDSTDPVWAPDESALLFSTRRDGHFALVRKRLDSAGTEDVLMKSAVPLWTADWSSDNKFILYEQPAPSGVVVIDALPKGSQTPIPITDSRFFSYGARLSPDGKWLAYASNETGQFAVYVQRFLEAGQRTMIAAGIHPRWTRDGRELVYWTEPGGLNAVSLTFDKERFVVSAPRPLLSVKIQTIMDGRPHHDVSRDGERFLIRQTARSPDSSMTVVLNWTARMNRPTR